MAAFCRRNSEMENLVCSLSPSEGSGPRTALHRCAVVGNSKTMAALIAGGCAVDLQDQDENTALHEASWHGFSPCVKLLIRAGADVHIKNKTGNTALHLACQNGHSQTAQLLLIGGSNPDTKNKLGDTCVHVAARYNNPSLLKILLRAGCSVSETNQVGDTALHVAAALNHKKVVQLLLTAGVDGRTQNKAEKTALDKARANRNKGVALLVTKAPQVHVLRGGKVCYQKRKTRKHRVSRSVTEETPTQTDPRSAIKDLTEDDLSERNNHLRLHNDRDEDGDRRVFQLFTLYRDKEGKAPASSCPCEPLLKKVEDHLKATEEEVRLHILNVQKEVSRRLDRMERRTRHQLRVLDLLNQERAAAETRNMMFRMEQRVTRDRAEALRSQVAARHELKSWCLSLLEDKDLYVPAQTRYHKPLLEPSAAEPDPLSADSSASISTNNLRSRCAESLRDAEQMRSRKYFELKEDRSSDQNQNPTAPAERLSGLLQISAAPSWQPAALQDSLGSAEGEDGPCNSSRSISGPQQEHRGPSDGTTVLEFTDRPTEPTLSQERNHLRAMEATQRFFDVVTSQLERWCCRRILEVQQQSALRAQADRKELLQRITELEEELHRLRTREDES
ncbi:ankyrin repeat domain-containing protein 6 [Kryptolebias marmoratus]|uniref:ankyrin repeat domain-containing protein 6 n=1 Tax=Kryptolebias marmoratus TaxID=37003 RepID=UPI0018ACF04E|nr:ankyrin repeat domain-containing protein 6 [Kryptolebias marmoratus]